MADGTKLKLHEDTESQTQTMAAEVNGTTPTTEVAHQPKSLMSLPPELRLDILERVVRMDAPLHVETSNSGERLRHLWVRLFLGRQTQGTKLSFAKGWEIMIKIVSDSSKLYTYQPRVPAILQTNRMLREEGRDAFLKFAKVEIAAYKAAEKNILPGLSRKLEETHLFMYIFPTTRGASRTIHLEMMQRTREMAERCLRWYALKEICEVLG